MTEEQKRILDFIGNRTEGDVREAFGALEEKKRLEIALKNSTETVNDLSLKVDELQKADKRWQTQLATATEMYEVEKARANAIWLDYKNKNDDYNAIKKLTESPLELIKLFIQSLRQYERKT